MLADVPPRLLYDGPVIRLLVATMLFFLAACSTPRTEVIIALDTDFDVPAEVDSFVVTVTAPDARTQVARATLGPGESPLPRATGVLHTTGPLGPFTAVAEALLGGTVVATRRARFTFVAEQTRVLEMHFLRSCQGVSCGAEESCDASGCRSVDIDPMEMPPYGGTIPGIGRGDGGVDSGMDGGPDVGVDAGPDVGVDAGECPAVCNAGCAGGQCQVLDPTTDVRCPSGMPCRIRCEGDGACPERLHCPEDGQPCTVTCVGPNSCARATDCEGASTCDVTCTGADSCAGSNNCKDAASCNITCDGPAACAGKAQCRASDCTVLCSGEGSCVGANECGLGGRCAVTCSGDRSCAAGTTCPDACACSVTCGGAMSCGTGAMCPAGCDDGAGCTSAMSCDTCP
ncbi:MAG: hypothetical protein DRJ42_16420 [Deltaproteobacteria bacterium]|nr:MAG: hypothetical protein DRJ42_16420 [Deltaproteobacteria bacterium]